MAFSLPFKNVPQQVPRLLFVFLVAGVVFVVAATRKQPAINVIMHLVLFIFVPFFLVAGIHHCPATINALC